MAQRSPSPNDAPASHRSRKHRHRIDVGGAPEPAAPALEPADDKAPARPGQRRTATPAVRPTVHDQTSDAVRRPAQLSDRCAGCGASTRGRTGMVTELVEVGPVRALRVVACSVCPGRHRRAAGS
jgi:hypothetical protein